MTWFDRHERFADCKPNEVYIGMNVFAEFEQHGPAKQIIRLRTGDGRGGGVTIDHGSVNILAGALAEWKDKHR